jgi:hypothetical protein
VIDIEDLEAEDADRDLTVSTVLLIFPEIFFSFAERAFPFLKFGRTRVRSPRRW